MVSGGMEVLGATPVEETNMQSSRNLELTEDGLFLVR